MDINKSTHKCCECGRKLHSNMCALCYVEGGEMWCKHCGIPDPAPKGFPQQRCVPVVIYRRIQQVIEAGANNINDSILLQESMASHRGANNARKIIKHQTIVAPHIQQLCYQVRRERCLSGEREIQNCSVSRLSSNPWTGTKLHA